ncbi:MAG TPA: FAD-dependent monooxygenase [Candidatus Binataceae bacterium]|nr:FAD-dependent monooxygenase [Candidatus Binataceae bacterium]
MAERNAIVIGGSLGGVCAARMLADYYDHVTVIDRDAYPAGAHERPGVPQSRHVHALLMRGRVELERLFPGFEKLMFERGAIEINFGRDFAAMRSDGWAERRPNTIVTLFASRVLLETTVRELLRRRPNVELIERAEAVGFTSSRRNGNRRVTGVKVNPRDGAAAYKLSGALVVDASGRATKCPAWIEEMGLRVPKETVVDSHPGYASRWYNVFPERRPKEWWWKGAWIDPVVNVCETAGVMFPVEGNRMIVTLAGIAGNYPPTDPEEFTAALNRLRSPLIAKEVELAEPISQVYSYRQMANRWRRYELWDEQLDGFIALGDAACGFNPVYGQGMTSSAVEGTILGDVLKENGPADPDLPRKFFAAQAAFQAGPWAMATGADFSIPGCEGERPLLNTVIDPVIGRMLDVLPDDPEIADRFGEVFNMMKPPSSLFDLDLIGRVAKAWAVRLVYGPQTTRAQTPMPPLATAEA